MPEITPSYVNDLSPFKPFIWSCFEVKVPASHIPKVTQSFTAITVVAPGEAVSATSLPHPFLLPPPSHPHRLFSHGRLSAYFGKRCLQLADPCLYCGLEPALLPAL